MKVNNLSDCIKTNLYRISVAKYNRTFYKVVLNKMTDKKIKQYIPINIRII